MNFYAFSALVNSITFVFVAFALLMKKNKPRAATYFLFFTLSTLAWSVPYIFWQTSANYGQALFWVKMLMLGAIFVSPTFLHFSAAVNNSEKKLKGLIIFAYLLTLPFIYLNFASISFIAGLQTKMGIPFFPTAGVAYYFYLFQWIAFVFIAFILLYKSWRQAMPQEKELKAVLFVSTLITFISGSANYFLWFDIPIPPVTTLVTGAYAIATTFLLLKGKFYKINLYYFEFAAGLIILVSVLQFLLGQQINPKTVNLLTITVVAFASYFLVKVGRREREHLEKIDILNHALSSSLENIINSITDGVLIASKKLNIIKANKSASQLFGYQEKEYPLTYNDFIRGKINQALTYAMDIYLKDGTTPIETEMLIPQHHKLTFNFSPFTMEKENDAVIILIKTRL